MVEPVTMGVVITQIGLIFTACIGFFGQVVTMIVANPILLLPIGLTVVGTVVGMAKGFVR